MEKFNFDGVIFDLDGVITKTASVHSRAWKRMFDEYLHFREEKNNEPYKEFKHIEDYLPFVDGKPRYKGVEDFLKSRNISIPFGDPADKTSMETICGLGNRKNEAFNEVLKNEGVEVFESTVALMKLLKEKGLKIGVASSSKNCENVLKTAKLEHLVETRVDGVTSTKLGLKGKPEADIFTVAADNLGLKYHRTVVVEDAKSGVQAGRKGNFGLVLGLAREENKKELLRNGADIAVGDIEEFGFEEIEDWFKTKLEEDSWRISYHNYVPEKEKTRESLLTVGNGYLGTRGAFEENDACETNYPGTYIAGLYNRLESKVGGRMIENEDFVNCPNWLPITFMINNGKCFDINDTQIIEFNRFLNIKNGELTRILTVRDEKGNETKIESKRIASMDNPHLATIQYNITPINYNGIIIVKAKLDGNLINDGVKRYRGLNQKHLTGCTEGFKENISWLMSKTSQSEIEIALVSKINLYRRGKQKEIDVLNYINENAIVSEIEIDVSKNEEVSFEKIVSIFTSKTDDSINPLESARKTISESDSYDSLLGKSEDAWKKIWDEINITIEGDRQTQKLIRFHLYHLMVSMSPHNASIDASATARGLHGEAYRGHIFWDELFIQPFYNLHFPETAKTMLMYRYNRLGKARHYAKEHTFHGAMFPWQSGSDGREETQVVHLNPLSGKWGDDYSSLQRHVSIAIAYNIWHYFNSTEDVVFLEKYGSEMFLEIARFWASKADFRASLGKFSISNVMGPDEFHEKHPQATEGGLRDNAYTNIMASWVINRALEILNIIDAESKIEIVRRIDLSKEELTSWKNISDKLNINISDEGIISQYDGYFDLKELDWDAYLKKNESIYRMDRILKAEGKSADNYKVAKQADTLMTFYNLPENQVSEILSNMNYNVPKDYLKKNFDYYLQRTSHGSTLSRVVHSKLASIIGNQKLSWDLYLDALTSDFNDIQGGTTGEGIHLGVMAATVMIAINTYAGVDFRGEFLSVNPSLPEHWEKIKFSINFKQVKYEFEIEEEQIHVNTTSTSKGKTNIKLKDKILQLEIGKTIKHKY